METPESLPRGRPWVAVGRWVFVFVALFVVRLQLRTPLIAITPEECHTGGMARDLLAHGIQFPLLAYTPEYYENGIILQGFLAVPFVAAMGPTVLALKVLSLVVSLLVTMLGLALLGRLLDALDLRAPRDRRLAEAAYLIGVLFSPGRFLFEAMDALGDENEAAAMTLLILVLFFRRMERPTAGRVVALWVAAGWSLFFHKGTMLASALALGYELLCLVRRRSSAALVAAACAGSAIGAIPTFLVSKRSGHQDAHSILEKFPLRHPGEMIGGFVRSLLSFCDHRFALLALLVVGGGWAAMRWRRAPSLESPIPWLAVYVLLHGALMASAHDHEDYWYYGYPVWLLPAAALVAVAALWLRDRPPLARLPAWATDGALLLALYGALWPRMGVELKAPWRLGHDRGGACTWRFGRAFLHAENNKVEPAAALCRRLEGDAALECISGLGFEYSPRRGGRGGPPPSSPPPPEPILFGAQPFERQAYVFGLGRQLGRGASSPDYCARFPDPEEHRACELGARIECLSYADLYGSVLLSSPAPRPACLLSGFPLVGFAQPTAERLLARPNTTRGVVMGGDTKGCFKVLPSCYAEVSDLASALRKNPP